MTSPIQSPTNSINHTGKPTRWMGEILLAQPLSTSWIAGLSLLICTIILFALFTVDYTRKERVTGQLNLDKGVVKILAPSMTGVLTKSLVKEGDWVSAGQLLFVLSVERVSQSRGDTQAEILRQIGNRKKHLRDERAQQAQVLEREEATLQQRITYLKQELALLTQEIETQTKRYKLNQAALIRSKALLKDDFISQARIDEIEQEGLDQLLKLQNAQRSHTTMSKELSQLQSDLTNLPLTRQTRLSEFDRQILTLEQEITDSESRRELVINAPQTGRITTVLVDVGQTVQAEKPLTTLLPEHSRLWGSLYLPSRAYGFVEQGQNVLLRYPAYPYQKFGQYKGQVLEIGRTALSAEELKALGLASTGNPPTN
jgi:membrane fusion protein